jgi:hypothetical protein
MTTTDMTLGSAPLLRRSRLPLTAATLRRLSPSRRPSTALRLMRRLWAAVEHFACTDATCDRCGRPMLESCCRGVERVCIHCVSEEASRVGRPTLEPARPEDPERAGAAAVLRALLLELQVVTFSELGGADNERVEAMIHTAYALLWWLTPVNLRVPGTTDLDEREVLAALERFDAAFGVRASNKSLVDTYAGWRESQRRACRYYELTSVDRKYAELVMAEALDPKRAGSGGRENGL